jgi:hypothetical protein
MSDSCQPTKDAMLRPFRVYSIIIPCLLFILFIETVVIFSYIPISLGSALTITGSLPKLPQSIVK